MSEQFILNTVFKHEIKPIDEQAMRDYLAFIKRELDPESEFWLENIWYSSRGLRQKLKKMSAF